MLIKSVATEQLKTISPQAPRFYIQPKIHKQGNPGKTVITTFVSSILTLNNFVFNGKNYSEIKGCAMGTICAPAYNNIFMGFFERKYICPFLERLSLSYLRFIDNIFFIWTVSNDEHF